MFSMSSPRLIMGMELMPQVREGVFTRAEDFFSQTNLSKPLHPPHFVFKHLFVTPPPLPFGVFAHHIPKELNCIPCTPLLIAIS